MFPAYNGLTSLLPLKHPLFAVEREFVFLQNQLAPCFQVFKAYLENVHFKIRGEKMDEDAKDVELNDVNDLLKWVTRLRPSWEVFVLCLLDFGFYSTAVMFFNDIDIEKLTLYQKYFSAASLLCTSTPLINYNEIDRSCATCAPSCLGTSSVFERHAHLLRHKLNIAPVIAYFEGSGLLNEDLLQELQTSNHDRINKFLAIIKNQPSTMLVRLYHALLLSSQFELFAFLIDENTDWSSLNRIGNHQRELLIEEWLQLAEREGTLGSEPELESEPEPEQNRSQGNENSARRLKKLPLFDFEVDMPDTTTAKDLSYYRTDKSNIYPNFSVPKGLMLLINNENFLCDLNRRHGTVYDEERLRKLFTDLGYIVVKTHRDLTGAKMISVARDFVRRREHQFAHSCIVAVLTHGEDNALIGVDGCHINVHDFYACFNSRNAPTLAGKPKLFIMQACRGGNYDTGVQYDVPLDQADALLRNKIHNDHSFNFVNSLFSKMRLLSGTPVEHRSLSRPSNQQEPLSSVPRIPVQLTTRAPAELAHANCMPRGKCDSKRYCQVKQPTEADILIANATVPRYVSWRNSGRGSWFVQSLCEVFAKRAAYDDVLTMLTKVNQRVAKEYESSCDDRFKQIPEANSRLRKKFYLFPGIVTEN